MMLLRYLRTARYLRAQQLGARVWRKLHRPAPDPRPAPPVRVGTGTWVAPVAPEPRLVGPEQFRALNVERRCAAPADWSPEDATALWTYNLHYFDDLNARDSAARAAWQREFLGRWLSDNPAGHGPGWDAYPLSKRIANWVKWARAGNELDAALQLSLAMQARWLLGSLEYHLLGNHLFANAKALVHAGVYFAGEEAEKWYVRGMDIIARELPVQVLSDGGQFERTPMYHAAALEDLLDLVNILRAYGRQVPDAWLARIPAMRRWLKVMSHPDGELSFFNDAALGIAPSSAELERFAERLGLAPVPLPLDPLLLLEPSGYVRLLTDDAYLLCDCAPVGPDYLPAHAHADTLSFELSLLGRRVLVNSGTSVYGIGAERQRQRSTAAHNTVVVNGQDSSEVWAGFRVARRARPRLLGAQVTAGGVEVVASHDGYARLPGRNQHQRRWLLGPGSLRIDDHVSGSLTSAAAYFHMHPRLHARADAADVAIVSENATDARLSFVGAAQVAVAKSTWHPEFGLSVANEVVVARFAASHLGTRISWGRNA
jgi:uncharacterized heparinase superfamily protein